MDITDYRKKKKDVEMRATGNGILHVFVPRYSPATGDRMPDDTGQVNIANFPNELQAAEANVQRAVDFLEDLKAFIADATKADAEFGAAAKKPGK